MELTLSGSGLSSSMRWAATRSALLAVAAVGVAGTAVVGGATAALGVALITAGAILGLRRSRPQQAAVALALLAAGVILLAAVLLSVGGLLAAVPQ